MVRETVIIVNSIAIVPVLLDYSSSGDLNGKAQAESRTIAVVVFSRRGAELTEGDVVF
jgi:hypothetical protein